MSAAEQAVAAAEQAIAAAQAEAAVREAAELAARERAQVEAWAVAAKGIERLQTWFPSSEWRVDDDGLGGYYHAVVVMEKDSDPRDPLKVKVDVSHLKVIPSVPGKLGDEVVTLSCVELVSDTSMPGYSYYSGAEVKSAADVGRWLLARSKP